MSSAPGESSAPLPGRTHGTVSDIRRDIRAIVTSEFERNATDTRAIVSEVLHTVVKGQEVNDSRNVLVSDIHTLSTIE